MIRQFFAALCCALWALAFAPAALAQQSAWDGVARVVVIGDLHGDYPKFEDMLRNAGLVDARGDWAGGATHLVQLGDVPDRGDGTRRILDHLMRLERQAEQAGGRVHALIGNHEAMNFYGDLRYVTPGEYSAFVDRRSSRRRDAYYARLVEYLRANPPPTGPVDIDDNFRNQWRVEHPLGWVEHRFAWGKDGEYGRFILSHNAIVRIDDTLYLHGGIGPAYAASDIDTINNAVRDALAAGRNDQTDPVLGDAGPLWYRGLALNDEATETPNLEAALARYGVRRIVLGHTKRAATIYPRFSGRVVLADVAVAGDAVDPHAYLVKEGDTLTTVHRGQRIPFRASNPAETCAYLGAIAALEPAETGNALRAGCP